MKKLTKNQYKKLTSIEWSAKQYANSIKKSISQSSFIYKKRCEWIKLAQELEIITDGENVRYTTECGKDYSYGYNFTDCLA